MKNHGFSLVELAIVLVIIGLITGGILTGQDLIRASELNSIYADANKYKVAFNTFKLKYNAIPGDMSNATAYWTAETCPGAVGGNATGTCNGDNDGMIDYVDWVTPTGNEHYRTWEHLALSGLISGTYAGLPATGVVATAATLSTSNVPLHEMNGFFAIRYVTSQASYFSIVGHSLQAYGANFINYIFTAPELSTLDTKYDDGKPGTGMISSFHNTLLPNCATTDVASTAAYTLTGTTGACVPIFWIK